MNGRAKHVGGADHVVAGTQNRQTGRRDGRHAGGDGKAVLGALERGKALLEHADRRIGEARVDVALGFTGKALCRLRRVVKHETRGQEDRLAVLVELRALRAGAHSARIKVETVVGHKKTRWPSAAGFEATLRFSRIC